MKISGPCSREEVDTFLLETVIPLRLAVVDGNGFPSIVSLWFLHEDGDLWCATQQSARVVSHLRANDRCGFEIATNDPPYRGVRGSGRGSIEPAHGERVLRALIQRYQGSESSPLARWLLARVDSEVAIRIAPRRLVSWNYRKRMAKKGDR